MTNTSRLRVAREENHRRPKSESTKNGVAVQRVEFRGQKRLEKITVHAQKDLDVVVRDTETRTIGEDHAGGASRTTLKMGDDQLDVKLEVRIFRSHCNRRSMR